MLAPWWRPSGVARRSLGSRPVFVRFRIIFSIALFLPKEGSARGGRGRRPRLAPDRARYTAEKESRWKKGRSRLFCGANPSPWGPCPIGRDVKRKNRENIQRKKTGLRPSDGDHGPSPVFFFPCVDGPETSGLFPARVVTANLGAGCMSHRGKEHFSSAKDGRRKVILSVIAHDRRWGSCREPPIPRSDQQGKKGIGSTR